MAIEEFDQITFLMKSGKELTCFMLKEESREIADELFDKLKEPTYVKVGEMEEKASHVIRIDAWACTKEKLIVSVTRMASVNEIAAITIIDAPKFTYAIPMPEEENVEVSG